MTPAVLSYLTHPCPLCGVEPGQCCVTVRGRFRMWTPHIDRMTAATHDAALERLAHLTTALNDPREAAAILFGGT